MEDIFMSKWFKKKEEVMYPNSFERAVWKYATCPLSAPLPEPQTREEQIAKAFVFSEKAATNISYLKEINRCVGACEMRQQYDKNPEAFNGLRPIKIHVGYGKGGPEPASSDSADDGNGLGSVSKVTALQSAQATAVAAAPAEEPATKLPATPDNKKPAKKAKTSQKVLVIADNTPVATVLEYCFEVTKNSVFSTLPVTSDQVISLITAVQRAASIFKAYPSGNQLAQVLARLDAYKRDLMGTEAEEAGKQYRDNGLLSSRSMPICAAQPPADVPPAEMLQPKPVEKLWPHRMAFVHSEEMIEARAVNQLVSEFADHSLDDLEDFYEKTQYKSSSWIGEYIAQPLKQIIEKKKALASRGKRSSQQQHIKQGAD